MTFALIEHHPCNCLLTFHLIHTYFTELSKVENLTRIKTLLINSIQMRMASSASYNQTFIRFNILSATQNAKRTERTYKDLIFYIVFFFSTSNKSIYVRTNMDNRNAQALKYEIEFRQVFTPVLCSYRSNFSNSAFSSN